MGFRSSRRILLHLIQKKKDVLPSLIEALQSLKDKTVLCDQCYVFDICNPCSFCLDIKRNKEQICIVSDVLDVWSFERSRSYKGLYHVLGGVLSAVEGVYPDHLTVPALKKRQCKEMILALPPTIDGQTTLHYILQNLKDFEGKITTLAHGIPLGANFEFLDEGTLAMAFAGRKNAL